ncbi:MAG: hypothetical protein NXI32_26505 [bacterium]|nr:hypothetical protein [bacterium]
MFRPLKYCILTACLVLCFGSAARADLMFEIQRVSNSEAILVGSGAVGTSLGVTFNSLFLQGAAVSAPLIGSTTGDFQIGSYVVSGYAQVGGDVSFPAAGTFLETDTPSGTETIFNIDFGSVGREGDIVANIVGGTIADERVVGRWRVTAVPEPGALGVLALLGSVLMLRSRR